MPARRKNAGVIRVLIVDDNDTIRQMLRMMLRKFDVDVDVDCVGDGKSALRTLQTAEYDLILMDWHMPIMDGLECTRKLREMERIRNRTRIVACTAHVADHELDMCYSAGVDDVLTKPFTFEQLCRRLCKWLPGFFEWCENSGASGA